jgi:hypothetical protein
MTEWADELKKKGMLSASQIAERVARYQPPDHNPAHYPFPIRKETGMRDYRV